jgi:hypothetical protein
VRVQLLGHLILFCNGKMNGNCVALKMYSSH